MVEHRHELDRLLDAARAELRDWTDSNEHDPSITLLELMAYVAEMLADRADAVANEAYLAGARRGPHAWVEVDGARWERVSNLYGSGPDDPHYLVERRDDGATTIEFGDGEHGRRPPTGAGIRVACRRPSRFVSVDMQEGRVVIDSDWNDPTGQHACGIHRAVVIDATDPTGKGRLLVQIPAVAGAESLWALPCFPVASAQLPMAGQTVWVLFEEADGQQPVWMGRINAL